MANMTEERAKEMYYEGLDCSQATFGHGMELMGMDPELGYKVGACFGGGMFRGDTCGCVTGSLMAIGMAYGHYKPNDQEAKARMREMKAEFEAAFIEENGSLICRELLGADIGTQEGIEKIMAENLLEKVCPRLIVSACEILDELL